MPVLHESPCKQPYTPSRPYQMQFSMFKTRFLGTQLDLPADSKGPDGVSMDDGVHHERNSQPLPLQGRPALRALDLKALQHRDDGPPSETQLRRAKFQFFDKHCSEVGENLFLSGDSVAKNRDVLQQHGISHVVNCVGFVCKEYFKDELTYRTYFLQDTPAEDILCVLYDAFEFIEHAFHKGGKVLVHCSQGVSRSATVVIAYLMWRTGQSYEEVFAQVKAKRGVANPNIGFTCQLMQWHKRRRAPPAKSRMYRMGPHSQHAPLLLVPRTVTPPKKYETHTWRQLDPRGAFIIQTPRRLYVWVGSQCTPAMAEAAQQHARLVVKYEATGTQDVLHCTQGAEPAELLALMDPPALDPAAEQRNARRASITGDLYSSLTSAPSVGMTDMDTDSPQLQSVMSTQDISQRPSLQQQPQPQQPQGPGPSGGSLTFPLPTLQLPGGGPGAGPGLGMGGDGWFGRSTSGGPAAHALQSPLLASPALSTPQAPWHSSHGAEDAQQGALQQQQQQQQHPRQPLQQQPRPRSGSVFNTSPAAWMSGMAPAWNVTPQEEYTPEYQLYADALRTAARTSSVVSGSSATADEPAPLPLPLAMAPSRQLRVSVTGTERSNSMQVPPFLQRFPGIAELETTASAGSADFRTEFGPGMSGMLPVVPSSPFGRPESPQGGGDIARVKKYRRGATEELEVTPGPSPFADLMPQLGSASSQSKRLFPSLHHSMDDEDIP